MVSLRAERERAAAGVRRGRVKLGIAAGAVVAAVAVLLVVAGGRPVPPGRSAYDAGTTDPVVAAVPVLAGYAERTRGLRFERPPTVRVVPVAAYASALKELPVKAPGDRAATARALGLTEPAPAAPAVLYSPLRKTVYVRQGTPVDAGFRVGLVRALTHALQDQAFGLRALATTAAADADRSRALAALVDGDAARVAAAYLVTQPAADRPATPPARTTAAQLTAVGAEFVTALGDNAAVDAAFRQPPTSTAQVVDPRAYRDGVEPLGVRAPPGEGQRIDAGTLGRYGLAALVTGNTRLLNAGAAGRWLGDSYGTFRSGRGVCTYANVVLADAASRDQLVRDLGRWVAARGGRAAVTRNAERGLRLRSCA